MWSIAFCYYIEIVKTKYLQRKKRIILVHCFGGSQCPLRQFPGFCCVVKQKEGNITAQREESLHSRPGSTKQLECLGFYKQPFSQELPSRGIPQGNKDLPLAPPAKQHNYISYNLLSTINLGLAVFKHLHEFRSQILSKLQYGIS